MNPRTEPAAGPQTLAVKRAEVEFHNFASLGEPERAATVYAEENRRRGALLRDHLAFVGPLSPFLEIGANAGHTSYLLANDFAADGFALDISADALRHGITLMDRWKLARAPVRMAGDGANLPFRDGSVRFVLTFQTLSQFMDLESVFREVKRVLAPGGIFMLAEEPLRRLLTLRLYRSSYYRFMKPWERRLYDWGLLGFLVKDVIGAAQEESFGIRQNHRFYLRDWHRLISKHFTAQEYEIFVREHGPTERLVKKLAVKLDPFGSVWRAANLLGGTLAAFCRKEGDAAAYTPPDRFECLLRCPDCHGDLQRDAEETLHCPVCAYQAPLEGGVYNLLPAAERAELYPGDRADVIDFSLPSHAGRLLKGWYELEGVFGNKYRWIGARASARLERVRPGPQRLRLRGHANEGAFQQGQPVRVEVAANGQTVATVQLERAGLFIVEADLPEAGEYTIEIDVSPTWRMPPDDRVLTLSISMIRLVPPE